MHVGQRYLEALLRPYFAEIEAEVIDGQNLSFGFELDPSKPGSHDQRTNLTNLLNWTKKLLFRIFETVDSIPTPMLHICAYMRRFVVKVHSEGVPYVLSGFFFLRFLCPILVTPEKLPSLNILPSPTTRRLLVLVAKILLNAASNVEFEAKEEYMNCCNPFIASVVAKMNEFYAKISSRTNLKQSADIILNPVQRQHYHLLHVAISTYDIPSVLFSQKVKKSTRRNLENELNKLGKPQKDQRKVSLLGYVDLENIVVKLKDSFYRFFSFLSSFLFPLSSFLFPLSSFLFPLSSFLFPLSSFLFPLSSFLFK
jgi:hypothetical protein